MIGKEFLQELTDVAERMADFEVIRERQDVMTALPNSPIGTSG